MAEEKKTAVEAAPAKEAAPKAKKAEKAPKAEKADKAPKAEKAAAKKDDAPAKAEAKKVVFAAPSKHDYDVIFDPHITEKSMALLQNANKVTVKVAASANKTEIKESFQRLYQVKVIDVKVINARPKAKSRGGRYQGFVSGYKKAVVTLAAGNAVDLFKA
jgi:large subunit ribosomal protein L23